MTDTPLSLSLGTGSRAEAPPTDTDYFEPYQRIPIPVHSMGPDGRLARVNQAWIAYTGYPESDAIGQSFAQYLEPASATLYRDKAVPELIETVPRQGSRSVEYRLIKASGEVADIVLTSRPERDPHSGLFLRSLAVISDITARNRAEAALRQAQKLEALGSLTSGVAHDFNNVLMIIQGSLQLLGRHLPPDDERAARLLDAAVQGARRGAALTARLLAFARQQELTPRPLDARAMLSALRPMLLHVLGNRITIEEDIAPDLWALQADRIQLELALLNLAANARDAMPEGGRLRLSARNVTASAVPEELGAGPHPAVPPGDHVVLTMSDTGIGMNPEALARAMDPFFTTKGRGKGTGLGLSMVHGFAVQSGGALLLSSQPGVGTTAELWLPRTRASVDAPEPVPAAAPVSPLPHAISRKLRILLVDDDPLVIAGTSEMLRELGHESITTAASGEAALALLRQDPGFDLLVTDHVMPGMSGAQLAIQARTLYPRLPILLASGYADLAELAGVTWPRLRKPYGLGELAAALAGAFPAAAA